MAFLATAVRLPGAAQRVNGDGAVRPAPRNRPHSIRDITAEVSRVNGAPSRCITPCASRTSAQVAVINPAHAKALKGHKTEGL